VNFLQQALGGTGNFAPQERDNVEQLQPLVAAGGAAEVKLQVSLGVLLCHVDFQGGT
jgi:hypothetical protein